MHVAFCKSNAGPNESHRPTRQNLSVEGNAHMSKTFRRNGSERPCRIHRREKLPCKECQKIHHQAELYAFAQDIMPPNAAYIPVSGEESESELS